MNEAKEILDALPKSREYYTTVRSAELARLREIAACFESADSQTAMLMIDCKETHRGRYPEYYEILEIGFLSRMEKAARLAEDLCK